MSDTSPIGALAKALIEGLVSSATDARRLTRGRTYLRDGAVVALDVEPGVVRGDVLGSDPRPYHVALHVPPSAWAISGADASSMDVATLKRLIPDYFRIRWTCTCPDGAEACKHAVAVALTFAQRIAIEPDLLVTWRSTPEVLQRALRIVGDEERAETRTSSTHGDSEDSDDLRAPDRPPGALLRLVRGDGRGEPGPPTVREPEPLTPEMAEFLGLAMSKPVTNLDFETLDLARPYVGPIDIGEFVLDAQLMIRAALRPM